MFAMLLPVHVTGGMELHTVDLAKGVTAKGHDVTLITTRHPQGVDSETLEGIEIHYVDETPTSKKPIGGKSLKKLRELHSQKPFDVIHSQSFAAHHYVNSGMIDEIGVPVVTTMHGTASTEIKSNIHQGLSWMLIPKILFHTYNHHFLTKDFIRKNSAVIAISKELKDQIPKEFGIPPEKVKTIYNGVDTEKFKPRPTKKKEGETILTVSVLHRQKGVQYLIKAMPQILETHPKTRLLVVGDGPYRKPLEELAERERVKDNTEFKGRIDNKELPKYYNLCDVFAIPTVRVEGLPLIELEAMACGKPVVASDIGGIPTVIEDSVNGILVEPGKPEEIAEKIIAVLSDKSLKQKLGENARKTIEEGFSKDKMVDETIKAYRYAIDDYSRTSR